MNIILYDDVDSDTYEVIRDEKGDISIRDMYTVLTKQPKVGNIGYKQ